MNMRLAVQPQPVVSPPSRLQRLVAALERDRPASAAAVAELVASSEIERRDLDPWVSFHHPVQDGYGRRVVASAPTFEVLVMSWRPADYSAIHDHGHAQCGAVQHFGSSDHLVYTHVEGVLRLSERERVIPGAVTAVDHDLIHQMGNPSCEPMVSLHVYVGLPGGSITGDARIFDLLASQVQRTDGGVFFTLPEDAINRLEPGPVGDDAATRVHHQLMLAQLQREAAAGPLRPPSRRRMGALLDALSVLEADGR